MKKHDGHYQERTDLSKHGKPGLVLFLDCTEQEAGFRTLGQKNKRRDVESYNERIQVIEKHEGSILEHYEDEGLLMRVNASFDENKTYGMVLDALNKNTEWMNSRRKEPAS